MSETAPIPPITGSATVAVPVDEAFRVFTGSIDAWWPHQFHIGASEVAEVVLEPGVDGRWYERGTDGTECDWGRVLVWDPPHRLVITWQINGSWQFDPDPGHASEIEVRFTASGPAETVVEVEHGSFERLIGGGTINDAIRGGGGWVFLLDGFGTVVAARS
ncbi:SRPBCC family protein [Pseudonocardia sp. KRD-184]|uniref:SRPBCC family protein n=1 Tax=Pseudonocardia oceani TaxID=2792013 RepID=A0ABS6U7K3_9PSEU|nr:SRPBCC family protein [Pseudonocardia oceani]MBW0088971.1 SRPBCC family protein [Pseudonocardia oceani]MBW0095724.1 SRPBCC family protein [Pseudonocardia oceani]MBW0108531.1 SRPBCC family protein [Pseudonocardia oceani]MBW0121918.1 SRPBCC family protein [Pseudonocardia oceani]MBW0128196.1 SRPBCC family protein [Pseudonocardia oceani]